MFLTGALFLGLVAIVPQTVSAYKGDPSVRGPYYTEQLHEDMTKAFENKDYNSWKSLMAGKGVARRINQDNFAKFAEAHELALQGRVAEANAIRAQLGLGQQNGTGMGQGNGYGRTNR